jgi:membrane protein YdbS with pleckstrin-like domain
MSEETSPTYEFRPAWSYQWPAIGAILLLAAAGAAGAVWLRLCASGQVTRLAIIALLALAVYLVLLVVYRRYAWRYTVDAERIESTHGLIARNVRSIRVRDLRNINVRQTFMQRLLNVGDVEFSSAGGDEIEVTFYGVPDPVGLKDQAQAWQRSGEVSRD